MDAIPVLSQFKSLIQVIFKDRKGAKLTQINFSRRCPILSQIRSTIEASHGNCKAAEVTQLEFASFLLSVVEGTPVLGHAVGIGYYASGYKNKGDCAMKSACRTTGVIGGGVIGFVVGGPIGATVGGTIGGLTMDGVTTGIESGIQKKFVPHGVLIPFAEPENPGKWADSVFTVLLDSMVGRSSGMVVGEMIASSAIPISVPKLSTVTAVVGNELWNKFKTQYGATVKKHGEQMVENITATFNKEFHDLLNTKSNPNNPLKSFKIQQIKKNLLKLSTNDNADETDNSNAIDDVPPSVLSVKQLQFQGRKSFVFNITPIISSSSEIFELRRSSSGYF